MEAQQPKFAQIGKVKAAKLYGGIDVETKIDPNARAVPVTTIRLKMCRCCPGRWARKRLRNSRSCSRRTCTSDEVLNEKFERPFKFHRMQPQTLYLNAWAEPTGEGESGRAYGVEIHHHNAARRNAAARKSSFYGGCRADARRPRPYPPRPPPPNMGAGNGLRRNRFIKSIFTDPRIKVLERAG